MIEGAVKDDVEHGTHKQVFFAQHVSLEQLGLLLGLPLDVSVERVEICTVGVQNSREDGVIITMSGPANRYDGQESDLRPFYIPMELKRMVVTTAVINPLDTLSVKHGGQANG